MFAHLTKVAQMDGVTACPYVDCVRSVAARWAITWKLDLSILTDAGVAVKGPPSAQKRPGVRAARMRASARSR